jgi:signal transduction histidine kinase
MAMADYSASARSAHERALLVGWRLVAANAGLALLYFGAAKSGLALAFATKQVTAIWPPTGVALAAFLLFGRRLWPGVFFGAFLANATHGETLATAAGIALGNALAPALGAYLLRHLAHFDNAFARLRDVIALLVLGAALAMTVSASNGVLQLALAGIVPWSNYFSVWWVWWVGDAMGVLLVAPPLLTFFSSRAEARAGLQLLELALLFVSLFAASALIFTGGTQYPIAYAVFPFIIWTALRFGQRETAGAVLLISAIAVWGAVHDCGPFARGSPDQRLIYLEIFMAVAALAALSLGAMTSERRQAQAALRQALNGLEARVRTRTAELERANAELARKNEEVEAFAYIVSHDLRAPLINLQGFANELGLSCQELSEKFAALSLPPAAAEELTPIIEQNIPAALRYIRASASKFQRLIDALLSLSRTGRQEYRELEVDMAELLSATVDSLQQSIRTRSAELKVACPLPPVVGDATALGQVFSNLISNSLNYLSQERPGLIEVGGRAENDNVHYWVKDNGVGIPSAARRRLFQVFQRFHPHLSPGEGMGLAIVKRVIERHHGQVWAESEEGVGTTFHISLPATPAGSRTDARASTLRRTEEHGTAA